MEATFLAAPPLREGETERLRYRLTRRSKSKFNAVLDTGRLIGAGRDSEVETRIEGGRYVLRAVHDLQGMRQEERFECDVDRGGLRPGSFLRRLEDAGGELMREERAEFPRGPQLLPPATYPETLLPFLMRGQPYDGQTRAFYSWTCDRFTARVYYEQRKRKRIQVAAGSFEAHEVWLYPDLNDWIALGSVVTKLAKPLLPRYDMWFETAPPHRILRFEGPMGPPGAPEIVMELS